MHTCIHQHTPTPKYPRTRTTNTYHSTILVFLSPCTHTLSLTHTLSHTHTHTLTHTFPHTLSLTHRHTHNKYIPQHNPLVFIHTENGRVSCSTLPQVSVDIRLFGVKSGLFCVDIRLFCVNIELFCVNMGFFCLRENGRVSCSTLPQVSAMIMLQLQHILHTHAPQRGYMGLFCGNMGLFCGCIGLFCREYWRVSY